jgi:hypothetical protein
MKIAWLVGWLVGSDDGSWIVLDSMQCMEGTFFKRISLPWSKIWREIEEEEDEEQEFLYSSVDSESLDGTGLWTQTEQGSLNQFLP